MSTPSAESLLLGLQLTGRRVIAVGGGTIGHRRILDYLAAGAAVTLIAPQVRPELAELADQGALSWERRGFRDGDLADAWLVHTATGDPGVDRAVFAEAERRRIWCVNAADALCTSARTPARGHLAATHHHPSASIAVLTGDPRQSVRLRDRLLSSLPG